jgi:hypothetical protein
MIYGFAGIPRGPTDARENRQCASRYRPIRPPRPGAPARNLSPGPTSVCDTGPAIRIWCVGVHEPSELLKKLLQFGSANAVLPSAHDPNAMAPRAIPNRKLAWTLDWTAGISCLPSHRAGETYRSNVKVELSRNAIGNNCERQQTGRVHWRGTGLSLRSDLRGLARLVWSEGGLARGPSGATMIEICEQQVVEMRRTNAALERIVAALDKRP